MGLTRIKAGQISDIDYKQAVRVITVSNITLSGGAPSTVDGINLSTNDRVLVAGQDTGNQNGIYYVQTLGTGANGTWLRTSDANENGEIQAGMIVMVTEGDVYKDSQWKLTTNDPIVIGSSNLVFEQNSAYAFGNIYANGIAVLANAVGGTIAFSAGNNIAITGNNTSKVIQFDVTGISLNSISNGTSNVNVVSSGGNVTIGVGGTDNVAIFSSTGEYVTGEMSVTGNIIGGNISTSGIIYVANTTNTSGNNTGALQVSGGGSFSQDLWVGGNINGNNVIGNYFIGDGSQLTGVAATVNRIFNGISEVNIGTTNGNANISIGSTSNVVVVSDTGEYVSGLISATGNITGNYIFGNGSQISGIDSFGTIVVTGQPDVVANSPTSLLTFAAGSNISIITDAANGIITFSQATTGGSIFATGGDMGTITESVTQSQDLGNVIDPVSGTTYNLGQLGIEGVVTNDDIVRYTITGDRLSNNFVYRSDFTVEGNLTAGNIATDGTISTTGNVDSDNINANTISLSGNVISPFNVTGDIIAGNLFTGGMVSAAGNVQGGNISTSGTISSTNDITTTANVVGGNLLSLGDVSAAGNLAGNYVLGNGALLTGITAPYSRIFNGNSEVNIGALDGNVNINIGDTSNVVVVSNTSVIVTGNVVASNTVQGQSISATGSVSANDFVYGSMVQANSGVFVNSNIAIGNINVVASNSAFGFGSLTMVPGTAGALGAGATHNILTKDYSIRGGTGISVLNTSNTITISTNVGVSITNTNSDVVLYPLLATSTSGNLTSVRTSSTKISFNPSTGNLNVGNIVPVNPLIPASGGTGRTRWIPSQDFVDPVVSGTITGTQTFTGAGNNIAMKMLHSAELAQVVPVALTGTFRFLIAGGITRYTTLNATGNWTINFGWNGAQTLNSVMAQGDAITCKLYATQGTPAFYANVFQIDNAAVTPKWQGGSAPSAGNANSTDLYTFTIVKTADATFVVFASLLRFA